MRPRVYLYQEPAAPNLHLEEIRTYLEALISFPVEAREELLAFWQGDREALAPAFARAKVRDPRRQDFPLPLPGEIDYERKRQASPRPPFGIVYEGLRVQALYRDLISREERGLGHIHIAFTRQLLATWEEGRYHLRVGVFGSPSILSTTGVAEAPARPREYYFLKQQYAALGMGDVAAVRLEVEFAGRILTPEDPRMTEVLKGYVLQAIFYQLTGEAFCPEKTCRLFNAHWQEEVIAAQLESGALCARHQKLLEDIRAAS